MPFNGSDCLFIHIPKCAGTSLEVALGIADQYPDIGLKPTVTTPDIRRLFGGGLQHLTIREIEKNFPEIAKREGLFSFSIVRDPVDRFISHTIWKNYRFSDQPLDEAKLAADLSEDLEVLVALAQSYDIFRYPFAGFEYREGDIGTFPPNDLRRHNLPQCAFLFNDEQCSVDNVYEISQLDQLENRLRQHGLLKYSIPHRMRGQRAESMRRKITSTVEEKIKEIYSSDMTLCNKVRENRRQCDGFFLGKRFTPKRITNYHDQLFKLRSNQPSANTVPRTLWLYWHQGWDSAPLLARRCLESWRQRNHRWKIMPLSKETLGTSIRLPSLYNLIQNISLTALSDIIRIHLLTQHGGVWADATTWCVRPLDEWLDLATSKTGFFAYANPAPDRPFSSWFLAATPGHTVAKRLAEATDNFWTSLNSEISNDPSSSNYFWFHNLFKQLLSTDPIVARLWQSGTQISADAPHYLQRVGLTQPPTAQTEFHIKAKLTNVYKLDRRLDLPNDLDGTVLGSLFDTLPTSI
jgi:mannosyltransferase OCH1-like enzyme